MVRDPCQGVGEWLVNRENGEPAAIQHVLEMPDSRVTGKQFSVKRRVLLLGGP